MCALNEHVFPGGFRLCPFVFVNGAHLICSSDSHGNMEIDTFHQTLNTDVRIRSV